MQEEIVNKVANSALVSFDLEDYYPKEERVVYDIKDNLFQGLILKEKDFRAFVKTYDWEQYKDKYVAIICSVDAIVPTWAYMLLATKLEPFAKFTAFATLKELEMLIFQNTLATIDVSKFEGAKVVVKGCGDLSVPTSAYVEITRLLRPVTSSIMYGEPCSTVPLYKKPRIKALVK